MDLYQHASARVKAEVARRRAHGPGGTPGFVGAQRSPTLRVRCQCPQLFRPQHAQHAPVRLDIKLAAQTFEKHVAKLSRYAS